MKIGITGTPGTGKTTVSDALSKDVIDMKKFAKERGLGEEKDLFEINVGAVNSELPESYWIEGHLAHLLDLDYCIVLRTKPEVLEKRLENRGYSNQKIDENVEAEAMDVILSESSRHKVYEIDTTGKSVEDVVDEIKDAVENKKERTGVVDWTEFL